ncbi:glycosyltransferase family 2 protein [Cecembia sp.]|uniref:glycosyltransferase family 2 protein n=1 Tax=Cecembia sp. TaxID=1898110 RepID=UPI0025BF683A|nr:glycosyltransferase family 2 protein [Cecembia sp.]
MAKAAIVILNYNGEETLNKFLPSVIEYSDFPVYVADNASSDNSIDLLEENFPQVRLISLNQNYGFAGGYNEALSSIQGKYTYYILLNSDVEVTAGWDQQLISYLEVDKRLAGVQPKILSFERKEYFEHAGAGGGFIDGFGYPYCRGRVFDTIEKDKGQYDDELLVDWVSGACMAVRADLFHESGGFESSFFAHMEEIDWCWRARCQGYQFKYYGKVKVYHVGGATLARSNPRKTYLNFRNNLSTLKRNLTKATWFRIYFARIFFDLLAAIVFLIRGGQEHAKMVFKAHKDFRKGRNLDFSDRKECKRNGKIQLLLWEYYIRGRKKYADF